MCIRDRITHSGGRAPAGSDPAVISVSVMTPMVFCASLVPWASDTSDADAIWPIRNPRVRESPGARRVIV